MAEFLQSYEKHYKKIVRMYMVSRIVWVLLLISFWTISMFSEGNTNWVLGWSLVIFTFVIRRVHQAFVNNVNTIVYKWMNDLDVDFAFDIFSELLQDKKRKDYAFVLAAYLNLLVIMSQFEEFDAVYKENQKLIQRSLYRVMPFYNEMFAGMMEDTSEFREILFKYRFSKYRDTKGKLSKKAEALRKRDEMHTVQQLFEMQDYEGTLNYLEKVHKATTYDHVLYDTYRQRCLYNLNQNYEIVLPDIPEFYCVKMLKHLKNTGEIYYFENAKEFAERCKADAKVGKKLFAKRLIVIYLCLIVAAILMLWGIQMI